MKITEKKVKGIVTKSKLPDADYVINPYVGCQHRCIYCYADFMRRFTGHNKEKWGEFIDVKTNAVDVLGDIEKFRGKKILISSVTDPYMPLEAKYKITRSILESLIPAQPNLEILTKGSLIKRDIDLLKQYNSVAVGFSISILNDKLSRIIEPVAASPDSRIDALKKCSEAGINTYVFVSPIFPEITDIEEIIKKTKEFADYYLFENLNVRPSNKKRIFDFLEHNKPELIPKYKEIFNKNNLIYWNNFKQRILDLGKQYNKEMRIYFHHGGFK